jgi:hypothetical protein
VKPTPGRIVHYRLTDADANLITQNRTGVVTGNDAREGDYYPAMVVRRFGDNPYINLQVFLDGPDSYWATSRGEGSEPGTWTWPPRDETPHTAVAREAMGNAPETMGNTHPVPAGERYQPAHAERGGGDIRGESKREPVDTISASGHKVDTAASGQPTGDQPTGDQLHAAPLYGKE